MYKLQNALLLSVLFLSNAFLNSFVSVSSTSTQVLPTFIHIVANKKLASYYSSIHIGNGQEFLVMFDTGSHEIWVPCKGCTSDSCIKRHHYNPSDSGELLIAGNGIISKFEVNYVSGGLKGDNYIDFISLGDHIGVKKQAITCASKLDIPVLNTLQWDGIVGLGFIPSYESERPKEATTLLENLKKEKTLTSIGLGNQFSMFFGRDYGTVVFGGYLSQFKRREEEDFVVMGLTDTSKGYWGLKVVAVAVAERQEIDKDHSIYSSGSIERDGKVKKASAAFEDKSAWELFTRENKHISHPVSRYNLRYKFINQSITGRGISILDSGTFLIYTPKGTLTDRSSPLANVLPPRIFSCRDMTHLPSLLFSLQDGHNADRVVQLVLRPEDYVLRFSSKLSGKIDNILSEMTKKIPFPEKNEISDEDMCVLGIKEDGAAHGDELGGWTFGQVFMRAFYTVFDFEHEKVGFVRARQSESIINEDVKVMQIH